MKGLFLVFAVCSAATSYGDLSARAKPVPNLGRMLEGYVGACPTARVPGVDPAACRRDVARFRRRTRGRLLRVTIEEPANIMRLARFDRRKGAFRIDLVPFFGARGFGMSVGRPRRLNARGQVVMRHIPVWANLPEDTPAFVFRRNLERGMVRLELVVVPKEAYRLRSEGHPVVRALEVELKGLRLVHARSGEVLAERTYDE